MLLRQIARRLGSSHEYSREENEPAMPAAPKASRLAPYIIHLEKNAASAQAVTGLKASRSLPEYTELGQVKYLDNLIEQDHRFIKRLAKPGMGFFSSEIAWRTLQGYEIMRIMRKGQLQEVSKGDVRGQVALVTKLFEGTI
jgi:transposase, IS6 family